MRQIYVADDEADIRQLIQSFLQEEGYEVKTFDSGNKLLSAFEVQPADLLVLDVMMPGMDGLSLCAAIRKRSDVPIILLTARDTDADYITGFSVGCDDYFTKPFSMVKLALRIRAIFGRMNDSQSTDSLAFGDLTIYPAQRTAYRGTQEIRLTNTEFSLLHFCCGRGNGLTIPFKRSEPIFCMWGSARKYPTPSRFPIQNLMRSQMPFFRCPG